MKIVVNDKFLKKIWNILKMYMIYIMIYHFYLKAWKFKSVTSSYAICMLKRTMLRIRTLKQGLNYGLIFKKVHKVIPFNQKTWLKLYIDMNIKLRAKAKSHFGKDFFKLMNNAVFGKTQTY